MKIAIIGSGISGLSTAWLLASRHQVTVFEAGSYAGGHSNAVDVTLDGYTHPVDTGFLVFNERTYPNLIALFEQLGVKDFDSEMSFSVKLPDENLEWAGSNLSALFAQRGNLFRPRFWRMIADILRFNRDADRLLERSQREAMTLGELLQREGYSDTFAHWYLLPMGAAIWSTPVDGMLDFPAATFLVFCQNHGLLQITNRPQWKTVVGSSRDYVRRLVAGIGDVRLNTPVTSVRRQDGGVLIQAGGEALHFDAVVMACHSDQSLALLQDADAEERAVLSNVRYAPNTAWLHTDASVMPVRQSAWCAWNYYRAAGADRSQPVAVTYWLNRLQPLPFTTPVFVTLNPPQPIAADKVLQRFEYDHPQLDAAAWQAQQRVAALQGRNHVYFAGAWTGYGFHEDGLKSGIRVAKLLGAVIPWPAVTD